MIQHIVLIKIRSGAMAEKEKVFNMLESLGEACGGQDAGIWAWKVNWSLDRRKVDLVEEATFENDRALQAFREHSAHAEFVNYLKEVADWWVGDYEA